MEVLFLVSRGLFEQCFYPTGLGSPAFAAYSAEASSAAKAGKASAGLLD